MKAGGKAALATSLLNGGRLPMLNGLSRLASRFLARPEHGARLAAEAHRFDADQAMEAGLVTAARPMSSIGTTRFASRSMNGFRSRPTR